MDINIISGVHSLRKGAKDFACSFNAITTIQHVNIRGGWNNSQMDKIYLEGNIGTDQMLGKLLAGRDPYTSDNLFCPPLFVSEFDLPQDDWRSIFPMFDKIPQKEIFRYLHVYTSTQTTFIACMIYCLQSRFGGTCLS